jgi:hypothetical protein
MLSELLGIEVFLIKFLSILVLALASCQIHGSRVPRHPPARIANGRIESVTAMHTC